MFDRAAPTYDEVAGAYHDHFGRRLVELAGVAAGDTVLDVACGRGAVLVPAAANVGPSGRAVGVDLSPEMVRLARARVAAAGVAAEVHVMDAENLDVRDGSFSVVLCGFGIFFLPDPEHALAGFRRSLAAGGTVGLSTWGTEDERWSCEDDLLADVVRTEHHEVWLADADEWWAWKWSHSLRGILEQLPSERLDRLRRDAAERIAAIRVERGLPLRLEALIACGRRGERLSG